MLRILVVDDEPKWRQVLASELEEQGHRVTVAAGGDEALDLLREEHARCDLILTDLRMEPVGGLALMRRAREVAPGTDVIMITAYADTTSAVEAMKLGAYDFLIKPFELDELVLTVARLEEARGLKAENRLLKTLIEGGPDVSMVGESAGMRRVYEMIDKVAAADATVLIRGESGTGKELVARLVHERSPRGSGPFKAVNCAALPESLLESELFGHERGAFTGADKRRIGLFEASSGGTLFLDEIGEVSPAVQSKLLRALEEREVTRLGSTESITVDTRVVAATNVDLEGAIQDGVFRRDLYYRLNVFPIELPPLRARQEDIVPLATRFLTNLAPGEEAVIDADVATILESYDWPGNVRELRNVIERATILAGGGTIRPEHVVLPRGAGSAPGRDDEEVSGTPTAADGDRDRGSRALDLPAGGVKLEELEARFIRQALERSGGNKSQAARLLGITRRALYCRIEKYGIEGGAVSS